MGLIRNVVEVAKGTGAALLGGFGGVMNQAMYQEYFTSGSMAGDVLMKRAEQVKTNGSSNKRSDANVISDGSVIDVQDNQCMIIVENGKVVEACMEPGRYTYNTSIAPSFFAGNGKFGERIVNSAKEMWEQAKVGGQRRSTQRVYFINTGILDKSINWGVGNVQFRHTQRFATNAAPYIIGVRVKGNGMARVRIQRPLDFYTNYGAKYAGGDNDAVITMDSLEELFKSCKSTMLQAITGAITELGSRQEMMYEDISLPENMEKIANSVNAQMGDTDVSKMGFDFYQFSTNMLIIRDEDLQRIQNEQENAYRVGNATLLNYDIQKTMAEGFKEAGKNGGVTGIMGMGMAMGGGMSNMGNIQPSAQPIVKHPQPDSWKCACGNVVNGKFCSNCGSKKSEANPADGWKCSCGAIAAGKFCPECGAKKPEEAAGWACSCGAVNKGKFCAECGAKKPVGVPQYRCDKCGWVPVDPKNPPRFCPECGDPFGDEDVK